MAGIHKAAPDYRTTVRSTFFRSLSAVSPAAASKLAIRLFGTPPKNTRHPSLERLRRFELELAGHEVVAWDGGSGPTVLLAHGWGGHAGQWTPFIPALLESGFHVVAVDMPGHGDSKGARTNLVQFTNVVHAMAERLGGVHALVGHSLGAAATSLAVHRGAKLNRLVLLAPPTDVVPFISRFSSFLGLPESALPAVIAELERVAGMKVDELNLGKLPPLDVPALLLHDGRDRDVPVENARLLAAHWPNARLVETTGLGHRKILFDPRVIETTVRFLRGDESVRRNAA